MLASYVNCIAFRFRADSIIDRVVVGMVLYGKQYELNSMGMISASSSFCHLAVIRSDTAVCTLSCSGTIDPCSSGCEELDDAVVISGPEQGTHA